MPSTTPEGQRLFIPALAPFYAYVTDLSWLIVRLTAGLMLLPHGIPKVGGRCRVRDGKPR